DDHRRKRDETDHNVRDVPARRKTPACGDSADYGKLVSRRSRGLCSDCVWREILVGRSRDVPRLAQAPGFFRKKPIAYTIALHDMIKTGIIEKIKAVQTSPGLWRYTPRTSSAINNPRKKTIPNKPP